jgi:ribosomal protein S18 acetylase RimI-like enzyme
MENQYFNNNNNINNNYNYILNNNYISLITLDDISQINYISTAYWGYDGLYDFDDLKEIICQNLSFCIKIKFEIIGFCLVSKINNFKCEIFLIAVKPGFINMKFGNKILSYCIQNAHKNGIKIIQLHVSKTNEPAIHLYSNLGFKVVRTIKKYYKTLITFNENDRDAYIMRLNIF